MKPYENTCHKTKTDSRQMNNSDNMQTYKPDNILMNTSDNKQMSYSDMKQTDTSNNSQMNTSDSQMNTSDRQMDASDRQMNTSDRQEDFQRLCAAPPGKTGYHMPGEFSPHQGTLLIWPVRPGSWGKDPASAREAFCALIGEIIKSERVCLLADQEHREEAWRMAKEAVVKMGGKDRLECLTILTIDSDDAWARDVCPTFVIKKENVSGINWSFNAWGGQVDGLYAFWDKDDEVAQKVCQKLGYPCYDAGDFVLEGGAVHSDGEGTILTTRSCLLSPGRNPHMSQWEIEQKLKDCLGAEKVLWLPRGIYQDETNEHVDNICAFTAPGEVVLAWTDNQKDPQYQLSKACYDYLREQRDARGRRIKVHKLPIPDVPVCVSREDLDNFVFEEGEAQREAGERLGASYVNFYFTNEAVLVPQFGGDNRESDKRALEILASLCRDRRVTGIDSRSILLGGGNIHCVTQQIPGA